jgi:hypothetical protein
MSAVCDARNPNIPRLRFQFKCELFRRLTMSGLVGVFLGFVGEQLERNSRGENLSCATRRLSSASFCSHRRRAALTGLRQAVDDEDAGSEEPQEQFSSLILHSDPGH